MLKEDKYVVERDATVDAATSVAVLTTTTAIVPASKPHKAKRSRGGKAAVVATSAGEDEDASLDSDLLDGKPLVRSPVLTVERVEQKSGVWYDRQAGLVKAGDARFDSPYLVGCAKICQVRDVVKLVLQDLSLVARAVRTVSGEALAKAREKEDQMEAEIQEEQDKLVQQALLLSSEEKEQKEVEIRAKQAELRKMREGAAYEEEVARQKKQRFHTRIKLSVYLCRKPPKARMVDIESSGVLILFEKGGDKFDGCLHTDDNGLGEWSLLEQGLIEVHDPFNFKGVCIVKRAQDAPVTTEPVMYGYARLDLVPGHLRSTDQVLGMRQMRDLQMGASSAAGPKAASSAPSTARETTPKPTTAAPSSVGLFSSMALAKATTTTAPPAQAPVVDVSRLKPTGFYTRQSDAVWQWLKKADEDKMDFDEFQKALDHLEIYLLEPTAKRLFVQCDLTKSGKITLSDFQIGLMMHEIIPLPKGLMPLDAFQLFDFYNAREINSAQFLEICKALGVEGDDKKLEAVFEAADEDHSAKIDLNEFKAIFCRLVEAPKELKRRGVELGVLRTKGGAEQTLRNVLDKEQAATEEAFKIARREVEEVLHQRRLQRDEVKRKMEEEVKQLKRLEKLTAAFKKQQRADAQKREARDRAKSQLEEHAMKAQLEQDQAALKAKREQEIRETRRKKEEKWLKEIRDKGLDKWDLRHQGFKEVPQWVYVGKDAQTRLDVLVLLDLSENKLASLPSGGFLYWMNSLRELNLAQNHLETIPAEIRNCGKLELLNLSSNRLTSLPDGIGSLRELKHLNLFNNHLKTLPAGIGKASKLRILNLRSNYITNLPLEIKNLEELYKADMADNHIGHLPDDLSKLKSITDLNLSRNRLSFLPTAFGEDLRSLKSLDLSYNKIGELPQSFVSLSKVQILRLRDNQLRSLGPFLSGLTSLLELDASHNALQSISSEIGNSSELQSLILNSNRLSTLPDEMSELKQLERLNLRNNFLTSMPHGCGGLTALKEVDMSSNTIAGELSEAFSQLAFLVHADLSHNKIARLPDSMGNLARLAHFDVSHNRLHGLPTTFAGCVCLRWLNLGCNVFKSYPDVLIGMAITYLDLSSNCLSYLPIGLCTADTTLETLNLSHNMLNALPHQFSQLVSKCRDIHLDDNPWKDLPNKWNKRWTPKEQTVSRSGYSTAEVVRWAHKEQVYYQACCDEWAESGPLHFALRASLQDFIQAVKERLGDSWTDDYNPKISRVYFLARAHGFVPRMHELSQTEEEEARLREIAADVERKNKVVRVREDHTRLQERLEEAYREQERKKHDSREKDTLRIRLEKAVSRYEMRQQNVTLQKQHERSELLMECAERAKMQEKRKRKLLEKNETSTRLEMARLLEIARQHPFF